MSHVSMLRPNYTTILAVTGTDADNEKAADEENEAQRALLNHVLLQRYGMNMEGRLGIQSSRGKLAQIYIKKSEGKTEEEKAKAAVKKVDALIAAFNKALDTIKFPNVKTVSTQR